MPKGYPSLTSDQKQEIIARVKDKGERVVELAQEYGIQPKVVYSLLSKTATGQNTLLELAKLKREKESLLTIIGELVANQKLGKKLT